MANKHPGTFFAVSAAALLADQASKYAISGFLKQRASWSFDIFRYFSLTLVRNTGICFGMLSGMNLRYFIIAASLFIAAFIAIYMYRHKTKAVRVQTALGMIEGGILGNMADRIRVCAVIDFINLHFWPVFNIADILIVSGICIMLLEHTRGKDVSGVSENR